MDGINQQGTAVFTLIVLGIFCGPFYIASLIYGYRRRKELIINPVAKWTYIVSLPLALLLLGLVSIVGAPKPNTTSYIGDQLSSFAGATLVLGALAAIYIVIKSLRTRHKAGRG